LGSAPVGDHVLDPGWTTYSKRVLYSTYDVTEQLKRGTNALGVMLGNGMYNVESVKGRYTKFVGSYGQPKLLLQRLAKRGVHATSSWTPGSRLTRAMPPIAKRSRKAILPATGAASPCKAGSGRV